MMHNSEFHSFLMEKEYKSERNIGFIRSSIMLLLLILFGVLTLTSTSKSENPIYSSLLIQLTIFLVISLFITAIIFLIKRNKSTIRFIVIGKFLSIPLDVTFFSFTAFYLTKHFFSSQGISISLLLLIAAGITTVFSLFKFGKLHIIFNGLSFCAAFILVNIKIQSGYQFSLYKFFVKRGELITANEPDLFINDQLSQFTPAVQYELTYFVSIILLTAAAVFLAVYIKRSLTQISSQQKYRRFLSPIMTEKILKEVPDLLKTGETLQAAVLYTDISKLDAIMKKNSPQDVISFLNHFLEEMAEIIYKHEGTIESLYEGRIRAVFGAPMADERAAENAVRAAFAMEKSASELRLGIPIHIGIGIHFGQIHAGNIGTDAHSNYTIFGEDAEIAKSIQELTKQTKRTIIISEAARIKLPQGIDAHKLGSAKIKGKKEGVAVYAPIAH